MENLLMTLLSGGATGILGGVISGVTKAYQKKQEHKQAVELRKVDMQIMEMESRNAMSVKAMDTDSEMLQASYKADTHQFTKNQELTKGQLWFMVLLDFFRGMMRPGTIFFLLSCCVFFYLTEPPLREQITHTVLYLTTTAVLWLYGARQTEKR